MITTQNLRATTGLLKVVLEYEPMGDLVYPVVKATSWEEEQAAFSTPMGGALCAVIAKYSLDRFSDSNDKTHQILYGMTNFEHGFKEQGWDDVFFTFGIAAMRKIRDAGPDDTREAYLTRIGNSIAEKVSFFPGIYRMHKNAIAYCAGDSWGKQIRRGINTGRIILPAPKYF